MIQSRLWRPMALAVLGAGIAVLLAGCGSSWQNYNESCLAEANIYGRSSAPSWVMGQMPKEEGMIYFVGRGVGFNSLDERGAYDDARDHCLQQLARQIMTRVCARSGEKDKSKGVRFLPDEQVEQAMATHASLSTDALAGLLVDRGSYFEQWYVEEEPETWWFPEYKRMKRWKCWVLMAIREDQLDDRVHLTAEVLKRQAAAPGAWFNVVSSPSAGSGK